MINSGAFFLMWGWWSVAAVILPGIAVIIAAVIDERGGKSGASSTKGDKGEFQVHKLRA